MGKIDLTGQRFGRLVVIKEAGRNGNCNVTWLCRCDCGASCIVDGHNLRRNHTKSCGCLNRERLIERNTKHGLHKHPLYRVWCGMMRRTGVHKGASDEERRDYIERGISVCEEWQSFGNFYEWAIEHGYSEWLQIDRRDNDRGYEPENCHFVTQRENSNNRRCTHRLSDGTPLAEFVSSLGVETCVNGRSSKTYKGIELIYRKHGSDEAVMRAYGEAIAYKFGMKFVPFRKMFKA